MATKKRVNPLDDQGWEDLAWALEGWRHLARNPAAQERLRSELPRGAALRPQQFLEAEGHAECWLKALETLETLCRALNSPEHALSTLAGEQPPMATTLAARDFNMTHVLLHSGLGCGQHQHRHLFWNEVAAAAVNQALRREIGGDLKLRESAAQSMKLIIPAKSVHAHQGLKRLVEILSPDASSPDASSPDASSPDPSGLDQSAARWSTAVRRAMLERFTEGATTFKQVQAPSETEQAELEPHSELLPGVLACDWPRDHPRRVLGQQLIINWNGQWIEARGNITLIAEEVRTSGPCAQLLSRAPSSLDDSSRALRHWIAARLSP